jgi:hypothetical protein
MAIQMVQVLLIVGREMGSVFMYLYTIRSIADAILSFLLTGHHAADRARGQPTMMRFVARRARCALRAQLTK